MLHVVVVIVVLEYVKETTKMEKKLMEFFLWEIRGRKW